MSTAQQLYRLQEVELEIESKEQSVLKMTEQLGDSPELVKVRSDLAATQQHQEELKKQQHTLEWEDDDLTNKLKVAEEELYSGRIKNSKELGNLQHETGIFKSKRSQIDEKILILMDQIEANTKKLIDFAEQFKKAESASQERHEQLVVDIEQMKSSLAELEEEKQGLISGLDSQISRLYYDLKKKRKTAVAKVSQGTCSACRIQLPMTDMQRVRSGSVVQCSSCQRILYLP
jgi:predicted  nucleic acid-binding Zn-ribbon protein